MRESPRRPLILKRRKLPFQRDEDDGPRSKSAPAPGSRPASDGVCIMDHPTMADTQVVVIPKTANLQSVIDVLTAKGKESGPRGPNKFILLSGNNGSEDGIQSLADASTSEGKNDHGPEEHKSKPLRLKNDLDRSFLDTSLTNIQWLGKMNASDPEKKDSDKENVEACVQPQEAQPSGDGEPSGAKGPLSERPPYSYMAMIQFAINSKKDKKMTLKDIYTWIEEHFTYFRDVAKPGWKNSIRHNLSLHDMFVRESTPDGKISFWTIKPEANRCLTLEQVYKPDLDPTNRCLAPTVQVCYQQQKPLVPDPKKPTPCTTERKMKPLLPRTNSYLVPIQLPLAPSIFLSSPAALHLSNPQPNSNPVLKSGCKGLYIAPKVSKSESSSVLISTPIPETKDECVADSGKRKEASSSRRKQRLVPPSTEEPVLLLPDSTFFDSGLASDVSTFQEADLEAEPRRAAEAFKTPVKASHPASSTPSKAPEPWKITPLGKGGRSVLDFSPIRTPQRHEHSGSSLNGTPFKDLPLFSSPSELLASSCPREPQNRSLAEGLVLDTMNDSLSKILVDISFSCLEDDDFGMANLSWSQFIPDLK